MTLFHSQTANNLHGPLLKSTCSFDELIKNFCIQTKLKLLARILQLPYKQQFAHQCFTIELSSNEQCTYYQLVWDTEQKESLIHSITTKIFSNQKFGLQCFCKVLIPWRQKKLLSAHNLALCLPVSNILFLAQCDFSKYKPIFCT